jgi:hypothetical protein
MLLQQISDNVVTRSYLCLSHACLNHVMLQPPVTENLTYTNLLITTKLLDFVHRPDFYKQKTQRFGNWICFRNVVFSVCRNPDDGQSPEA